MIIECPAKACGHQFADRNRASLIVALGADTAAIEVNHDQQATTECPKCGREIEFGLLMPDDDGVWRVSPFAGHADDVTVVAPPGGGITYGAGHTGPPASSGEPSQVPAGSAPAPPDADRKLRARALTVMEGQARGVSLAAQEDAVELALQAGVLEAQELEGARAWLRSRPR